MFSKELQFSICLYSLLFTTSLGWRPFVFEYTNVSTQSFVNFIELNSSISTNGAISMFGNFRQDVSDIYAKVIFRIKTSNNNYELELINKTINACEFFRNRRYEPILQVFYRALTKNGAFPKTCPIRKKSYFIKDALVDSEDFPPVMPSNKVLVEMTLMTMNGDKLKSLLGFNIYYRIRQLNEKISD